VIKNYSKIKKKLKELSLKKKKFFFSNFFLILMKYILIYYVKLFLNIFLFQAIIIFFRNF